MGCGGSKESDVVSEGDVKIVQNAEAKYAAEKEAAEKVAQERARAEKAAADAVAKEAAAQTTAATRMQAVTRGKIAREKVEVCDSLNEETHVRTLSTTSPLCDAVARDS